MKQFSVILLALVLLVVKCHSERPEKKCERIFKTEDQNCVRPCVYAIYHFVDNKYRIERKNIEIYKKFLIDYKAVKPEVNGLEKHLLDCWNSMKSTEASTKSEKCERVNNFERCVIDKNILNYPVYFNALKKINKNTNV
uniref:14 kDa salivary protein A n=1 Tax=Phlebotomus arabicus TaxID=578135 RepID=C6G4F5_9DIPT